MGRWGTEFAGLSLLCIRLSTWFDAISHFTSTRSRRFFLPAKSLSLIKEAPTDFWQSRTRTRQVMRKAQPCEPCRAGGYKCNRCVVRRCARLSRLAETLTQAAPMYLVRHTGKEGELLCAFDDGRLFAILPIVLWHISNASRAASCERYISSCISDKKRF